MQVCVRASWPASSPRRVSQRSNDTQSLSIQSAFLSQVASRSSFLRGAALAPSLRCSSVRPFTRLVVQASSDERLRLHNLSPEEGSRRLEKRKGRGHAAGQVRRRVRNSAPFWQARLPGAASRCWSRLGVHGAWLVLAVAVSRA